MKGRFTLAIAVAAWGFAGHTGSAWAACFEPPGDVTGDASTTVADVQCSIIATLDVLAGGTGEAATCAAAPLIARVDANCDAALQVADIQLVIQQVLGSELPAALDSNANSCPDACEDELVDCASAPDLTPCSDGDPCTVGDRCQAGACTAGPPNPCDDGDICTTDSCTGGGCTHAEVSCNDGSNCTVDACDSEAGGCIFSPTVSATCKSGDPCIAWASCRTSLVTLSQNCELDPADCSGLAESAGACRGHERACRALNKVIPPTWSCRLDFYDTENGCECNCGAPDPDCAIANTPALGCEVGQACIDDACVGEPTADCSGLNACASTLEAAAACDADVSACDGLDEIAVSTCNALIAVCGPGGGTL